ncbi:MAG: hypothetical protein K6E20_00575, partial [Acholeplasmatales bacterium]|nr:hypothetical protein [Acholeplasmatales bacterium]
FYNSNIDESILNNDKNKYVINDNEYDYNLNEFVYNIELIIQTKINAINEYLIDNNDKKLIKEFNIGKDKKI